MNCHVINPRITINIPLITPVTNHFEVSWHSRLGASSSHVQVSDVNHRGEVQQPIQKGKLRISTEDEANGAKNLEIDGACQKWLGPMPIACREVTMFYTIFFIKYFFGGLGVCTMVCPWDSQWIMTPYDPLEKTKQLHKELDTKKVPWNFNHKLSKIRGMMVLNHQLLSTSINQIPILWSFPKMSGATKSSFLVRCSMKKTSSYWDIRIIY